MNIAKAIAALLGAVSTWGVTAAVDGITAVELFGLMGAFGTAAAVWATPNRAGDESGFAYEETAVIVAATLVVVALLLRFA